MWCVDTPKLRSVYVWSTNMTKWNQSDSVTGSNDHEKLLKKQSKVFKPNVDKNLKRILRKANLKNTVKQDEKFFTTVIFFKQN